MTHIIYIKNMVCQRCKKSVEHVLKKLEVPFLHVYLGEVILKEKLNLKKEILLKRALLEEGFEWLETQESQSINQIKSEIITLVHHSQNIKEYTLSEHLSSKLHKEYSSLSKLFSQVEGITIEKYYTLQRIERVKELLVYNEHSLSEIADIMSYSSVAHLSSQFKKSTGMTPTAFKKMGSISRNTLDTI